MNKLYQRINWQNYPSDSTPLNESNLNKMDAAVDGIDDRVVTLDVTKLPVATANTMVKDVTFNETTGVFTITKLNGTQVTVNTALEKIATNFKYDHSTQKLILTLIDGTTQEVDLSALLTQYEFIDSDTIQFTIDSSGKVKASVVNGSITGDMLEPNYLANVTLQANKADTSAKNAKESEEKAAEYAESAKNSADSAEPVASTATGTNPTIQDSTNAPLIYGKFKGYTSQDGEPTPDNPIEINGLAKDGAIEVRTTGILGEETTAAIPTDAPLYERDYIEIYADGSGKLVRAMAKVVFDGSSDENLTAYTTGIKGNFIQLLLNDIKQGANLISSQLQVANPYNNAGSCIYALTTNNGIWFRISDDITSVADTRAWLRSKPMTVVYELATPTETPLTAEQVAEFKQLYTFEPVTNVLCDGEVEMRYYKANVNGETVGIVHKKVEASEKAIEDMQTEFEQLPNTFAKKSLYDDTTINVGRKADTTVGGYSTAEGRINTASGYTSHAEGVSNIASGDSAHAEGSGTTASADSAHAEGMGTKAIGLYSHVEGNGTIAHGNSQHVQGEYNVEDTEGKYAHIVGGGTYVVRKNIHTLDWDGNAEFAGNVVGKNILSSLAECTASTNDTDIAGASALAELNNSLKTPEYQSVTIDEYTATIYYRKVLNMVELNIVGGTYNVQPDAEITLCTLPEGYRPKRGFPIAEGYGKPDVRFFIGGDGVVLLQNVGTQPKSHVAAHCTYLV